MKDTAFLAADESDINITLNKNSDTYFGPECSSSGKGYNQFHLNAFYDINNNTYVDAVIQPSPKTHEIEAARTMIKRLRKSSCSNIILADRGYNSLDLLATITDSNCDYLFRAHAKFLKEIIEAPFKEFDIDISFTIVTKQTKDLKELRNQGKVKWLPGPSTFGKPKKNVTWFHPSHYVMKLRIVRFLLDTGEYETIVTSLDRSKFSPSKIKELYHLRWGI